LSESPVLKGNERVPATVSVAMILSTEPPLSIDQGGFIFGVDAENKLTPIAGGLQAGESPELAFLREVKEELGSDFWYGLNPKANPNFTFNTHLVSTDSFKVGYIFGVISQRKDIKAYIESFKATEEISSLVILTVEDIIRIVRDVKRWDEFRFPLMNIPLLFKIIDDYFQFQYELEGYEF
jgi:hypothetical protein